MSAAVRLGRIEITDEWLREVEGRTRLVSIPRADVRRVVLRYARVAERPILTLVIGIALMTAGAGGVIVTLFSQVRFVNLIGGFIITLLAGPWMIFSAVRHGLVLTVETTRGIRRLGFGDDVRPSDITPFLAAAASAGMAIERDDSDARNT